MFHKDQPVQVALAGRPVTGRIVRKQGAHGYMVRIPWKSSVQNFATGEVTPVDGSRDAFFKTADIQIPIPEPVAP